MVAVAMPVLSSVSSDAAVGGRRSIEATTTSDLVVLAGYPSSARVYIKVVRGGTIVGSATKRAFRGEIELNHGGGPDCWESRRTPNIRPGDRIVTRVIGTRIRDFTIVRGVFVEAPTFGANSITVSGRVRLGTGRATVNPGRDVLEVRVRKDGNWAGTDSPSIRAGLNAADVQADGSWTHTFDNLDATDVDTAAAGNETTLEWSNPGASELTVAEPAGAALQLPGCPPVERN